jgi:hypothetical protein
MVQILFYFSFFIFPHDTQWCRFFIFFIFHFSSWILNGVDFFLKSFFIFPHDTQWCRFFVLLLFFFPHDTLLVEYHQAKQEKKSGGIFRIWLRKKGWHFWIMNEFESVG